MKDFFDIVSSFGSVISDKNLLQDGFNIQRRGKCVKRNSPHDMGVLLRPFGPPDRQKALENRVMTTAEKTFKLEL
jgi:hypothetical protein